MAFLSNVWDFVLLFLWAFIFISALFVVFSVISDLIRDKDLNGWAKAIWVIALIAVPFLTALVYLIARGKGMQDRTMSQMADAQAAQEKYIKQVASQSASNPAEQIKHAKELLDSGAITQQEFDALKAKALA